MCRYIKHIAIYHTMEPYIEIYWKHIGEINQNISVAARDILAKRGLIVNFIVTIIMQSFIN